MVLVFMTGSRAAFLVDPTKLQIEGRARDLAMFNLAIDSKLRGCDVAAIRVEDVAAGGYTADRATVRQKKTGRHPVLIASLSAATLTLLRFI
jgi:hypothetical protein